MSLSIGRESCSTYLRPDRGSGNDRRNRAFQILMLVDTAWPRKVAVAAAAVDYMQPLGLIVNPHMAWGRTMGGLRDIVYFSHLPAFDEAYHSLTYTQYTGFFWALTGLLLLIVASLVFLTERVTDKKYSYLVSAMRAVVASLATWLSIPAFHCFAAIAVCGDDDHVWMFDESCWGATHATHFAVDMLVLPAFLLGVLVMRSCIFDDHPSLHYMYAKAHTLLDFAEVWYKVIAVFLFHILLSRGRPNAFAVCLLLLSLGMAAAHAFVLPYFLRRTNSLKVSQMLVAAGASFLYLVFNEEERGILLLALVPVFAAVGFVIGTARINAHCNTLLHAKAAGASVVPPKSLEWPAGLPRVLSLIDLNLSATRDLDSQHLSEQFGDMATSMNEMTETRLPYVSTVYVVTDVELASRFCLEECLVQGIDPSSSMIIYSQGVFNSGLLRFRSSTLLMVQQAWFLFYVATKAQSAFSFLDRNDFVAESIESNGSFDVQFQAYRLKDRLRRKLNIREEHHYEYRRQAVKCHEDVLVAMQDFWQGLMELSVDMVRIGALASSIAQSRQRGLMQFKRVLSDSSEMLSTFADFLEQVMHDKDAAQSCREEIKEMESRSMGGSQKRLATADSGTYIQSIIDGLGNRAESFGSSSNRTIQRLSLNVNAIFVMLLLIVGNLIFFTLITGYELKVVDKLSAAGKSRMLAQKAAYEVYDIFHLLEAELANITTGQSPFTETGIDEQREKLRRTAALFAEQHNRLTHGDLSTDYAPHQDYIKEAVTEVNLFPYGTAGIRPAVVSLWALGDLITSALHTIDLNLTTSLLREVADTASTSQGAVQEDRIEATKRVLTHLLEDGSVRFVLDNTPYRIGKALNHTLSFYHEESTYTLQVSVYVLAVLFVCILGVVGLVYFLFLWNFKKISVSKTITLQLFTLIPYDTLERLATEAKERLEHVRREHRLTQLPSEDKGDLAIPKPLMELFSTESVDQEELLRRGWGIGLPTLQSILQRRQVKGLHGGDTLQLQMLVTSMKRGNRPSNGDLGESYEGWDEAMQFFLEHIQEAEQAPPILKKPLAVPVVRKKAVGRRVGFSSNKDVVLDEPEKKAENEKVADGAEIPPPLSPPPPSQSDPVREAKTAPPSSPTTSTKQGKGKSAERSIPGLFWVTEVVVVLLSVTCLGVVFAASVISRDLTDPLLDRNQVADLLHDMDAITRAQLRDTRVFVQIGDPRFFIKAWESVLSMRKLAMEARLVELGAREEEMKALAASRNQERSVKATMKTALRLAAMAYGVSSAMPEVGEHTWSTPETELLRTQSSYDVLARFDRSIRPPPTPLWTYEEVKDKGKDAQLDMAQSLLYSQQFLHDHRSILESYETVRGIVDQRSEMSSPVEISALKSLLIALYILPLVSAGCCLCLAYLLGLHDSLKQIHRWLFAPFLVCTALLTVFAVTAFITYPHVDDRIDALNAQLWITDTTARFSKANKAQGDAGRTYVRSKAIADGYTFLDYRSFDYITLTRETFSNIELTDVEASAYADELRVLWLELRNMEEIAAALTVRASGTQDPRLLKFAKGVTWNVTSEEQYKHNRLQYLRCPKGDLECTDSWYTTSEEDLKKPPAEQIEIARNILFSRLYYDKEAQLMAVWDSLYATLHTAAADKATTREDSLSKWTLLCLVAGCVSCTLTWICGCGSMAYVIIELAENPQQKKHKQNNALFKALLLRCQLSLFAVTSVLVAFFVVSIIGVTSTRGYAQDLNYSSARGWVVANSHVYANQFVSGDAEKREQARRQLTGLEWWYREYRDLLYFGEGEGYNDVGVDAEQDTLLFGNDDTDTADRLLSGYMERECGEAPEEPFPLGKYPKYSHTRSTLSLPLDPAVRLWFTKVATLVATPCPSDPCTDQKAVLKQLRKEVDPILTAMSHSSDIYEDIAKEDIKHLSIISTVLLSVLIAVLLGLYVVVFRKMAASLSSEEAATNSMLKMIPHDVRESVPAISEFLQTGRVDNTEQLAKNFEQSERLLANILPANISRRLKSGESQIADMHNSLTILFTDLVGFTSISSNLSAVEIISFLNEVFTEFDLIAETLELEKIKTIGDAYFMVGGLENEDSDHALRVVEAALQMFRALAQHNHRHADRKALSMRLGIHTGPAVAGCIGVKKVAYDLWGESVGVAEKMESGGVPGRVHVSPTTREKVNEYFVFEPRGRNDKISFPTYLVYERRLPTPYMHMVPRVPSHNPSDLK